MAFIDDIQSKDTAIYPVIIFDTSDTQTGDIHISTKSVVISSGDYQRAFTPLLLSSPSIKESIDLENRKYTISTVTLKISNIEYNGERFSDRISSYDVGDGIIRGALNTHCGIFWVTPSIENENINFPDDSTNEAYLAYHGIIRDIKHDEKICNITLEDASQSSIHRDVPVTLLGTGNEVPDRYKNKPIPMVYGEVDKSPCVIKSSSIDDESGRGYVTVSSDRLPLGGSGAANPLLIYNKVYWEVLPNALYTGNNSLTKPEDEEDKYKVAHQYEIDTVDGIATGNFLLQGIVNTNADMNLLADGAAQVINKNRIAGMSLYNAFSGETSYTGNIVNIGSMIDEFPDTYGIVSGTVSYEIAPAGESPGQQGADFDDRVVVAVYAKYPEIKTEDIFSNNVATLYYPYLSIEASNGAGMAEVPDVRFWTGGELTNCPNDEITWINHSNNALELFNDSIPDRFSLTWDSSEANSSIFFIAKIYSLNVNTVIDIGKFFESDFYANIKGRIN